jgi:GT2 family glycosyltransferase
VVAVRSALTQSVPVEVIVMDDGSSDRTAEVMRAEFPSVRFYRTETSQGYVAQRNRAAQLANAEIIFSIDDDAIFTSANVVLQTLVCFENSRVGAVAIPYVEPRKSPAVRQQAPSADEVFVTDWYIGTAHALRKDLFLALGGYREFLVHWGEEMDYAIRMLQAGYVVRLGHGDVIHHMESPKRDWGRMDYFGRRNDILFAWHNVPMPYLPVHLVGTTAKGIRTALQVRRLRKMLSGIGRGYLTCCERWSMRKPVTVQVYKLHRLLRQKGPQLLSDIEGFLPVRS